MNPMLFRSGFMMSLFTTILFFGCTSTPEKTRVTVGDYQPPEWVNKGSGAFKDGSGEKVFYGVGVADGIRSASLRRSAADDRALAALAVQIETDVKRMTKDFQAVLLQVIVTFDLWQRTVLDILRQRPDPMAVTLHFSI